MDKGRRGFLTKATMAGLTVAAAGGMPVTRPTPAGGRGAQTLTPTEELMREHGVVYRLMSVYDECADRLSDGVAVPAAALLHAGTLVDEFLENYHEELEERYVFPALERTDHLAGLVAVLRRQHVAGRELAGQIIYHAGKADLLEPSTREALVSLCRGYARMYRAHAAREDTVLFPALRSAMKPPAFWALGERFAAIGLEKLGEGGYANAVARVLEIEKSVGIGDLDALTARP
ncbi:MAG: hemerythrin domain-containing protein [Planctomycetota bacterium]|jgi:hemerythrin-like domain-containing protein